MKKQFERFLLSPAYPVLLSIYPILTLFTANTYQTSYLVLLRPFLLSLLIGLLLFGAMKFFFREWHKSAFFTTFGISFLATYGHIENFLIAKNVQGASIYILVAWLFAILLSVFLNQKFKNKLNYASLAPGINLMAIILLLYPLGKTIQYSVVRNKAFPSQENNFEPLDIFSIETPPDIYYIILDGYGRSDVLEEIYDYDNKEFISGLESLGFYVAECAQSNYPNTGLSLTSALNMDYISNLNEHFKPDEKELFYLFASLENNKITKILNSAGYTTIAFATGFSWAEMKNVDIYFTPEPGPINEFEIMYLKTTFARFFDYLGMIDFENISAERYRERTRLVFNSFDEISKMPAPKFTFAHIIAPHPPFGFDAEGNAISPSEVNSQDGYVNQATYAGNEILKNVKTILENSESPPIIIIQGDHGPWTSNPAWRLSILNAYYFPEHINVLYPTITPVNSFRLILNEYLGKEYSLLPDDSFTVKTPYLYDFIFIENTCEK